MSTARRMDRARDKAAVTRTENGPRKRRERVNRDAKMAELIRKGTFPYTPAVMSWVSARLDTPTRQITAEQVLALAK